MRCIKITCAFLLTVSLISCRMVGNDLTLLVESIITDCLLANVTETTTEEGLCSDCLQPARLSIPDPDLFRNNWMIVDIPEIGLKGLTIGRVEVGNVVDRGQQYLMLKKSPLPVYILNDFTRLSIDAPEQFSYLAVVTDAGILVADLSVYGEYRLSSLDDALYLRDIDGDGYDEIIVQQQIGATGGAGQFWSRVFKVVDGEIHVIFDSFAKDPMGVSFNLDTGFSSEFLEGYILRITNASFGYVLDLDLSIGYPSSFFDENGKAKSLDTISCDTFFRFMPEDVDGDGIFEIVCEQYVSLVGHSNGIGGARSVMKYNPNANKLEIVQVEFIPAY